MCHKKCAGFWILILHLFFPLDFSEGLQRRNSYAKSREDLKLPRARWTGNPFLHGGGGRLPALQAMAFQFALASVILGCKCGGSGEINRISTMIRNMNIDIFTS